MRHVALVLTVASLAHSPQAGGVEVIRFGANAHGLTGLSAGQIVSGDVQMSLAVGPVGAVLNENPASALGVDSRGVAGAVDLGERYGPDKINLLGGDAAVAGTPESIAFSFNRPGVLRGLMFDGVKDETLEYFQLHLPAGDVLTIFDFEVDLRLTQQGFSLGALSVPGVTLLDGPNDDATGLNVPFRAGDEFVLSYGEHPYPPGYVSLTPLQPPNGVRWEGLVIVPEPVAVQIAALAALAVSHRARRTGRSLAASGGRRRDSPGRRRPSLCAARPRG